RIGPKRELKSALVKFWAGELNESDLNRTAAELRKSNWLFQKEAALEHTPSNDFSLYDHVLDTIAMLGAVPARYGWNNTDVDLRTYFAMARGLQEKSTKGGADMPAMEMTKWFDTNYHYIVPEFESQQKLQLASTKAVDHFNEAKKAGVHTRPVLLGPVSFLL